MGKEIASFYSIEIEKHPCHWKRKKREYTYYWKHYRLFIDILPLKNYSYKPFLFSDE